ncbi:MAG: YqcC family protein [Porticoccaceae bacterium]
MTDIHRELATVLFALEGQLRAMALWSEQVPDPVALASTQPFAVDTLAFEAWLQFIFLPRMRQLLDSGSRLPEACAIAPMAEEYFRLQGREAETLITLLAEIDCLLSPKAAGGSQPC